MNMVIMNGHLVRKPELKQNKNNKSYTFFTIGVNEIIGDKQQSQFIPCIAWNKNTENIVKFFDKRNKILVTGRVNYLSQKQATGEFKNIFSVVVNRWEFGDKKAHEEEVINIAGSEANIDTNIDADAFLFED